MHIPVMSFLDKVRMRGKIIVAPVFQDEVSFSTEDRVFPLENLVGKACNSFQLIRRIGENEVESAIADVQEIEDIAVNSTDVF